jgi:predicted neutral ceramidase superfamily lipid hydrolase
MVNFFSNFNPANPTWDLFLILFFVVATFLYGITLGRAKVVVQIVSSYMTVAVLASTPFLAKFEAQTPLNHTLFYLGAFFAVFAILCVLLSKSAFHTHLAEGKGGWIDVLVLSVVQIGFLSSIVLSSMSGFILSHLSPVTRKVFAEEPAQFVWTILPIAAIIVIRGRPKKPPK